MYNKRGEEKGVEKGGWGNYECQSSLNFGFCVHAGRILLENFRPRQKIWKFLHAFCFINMISYRVIKQNTAMRNFMRLFVENFKNIQKIKKKNLKNCKNCNLSEGMCSRHR